MIQMIIFCLIFFIFSSIYDIFILGGKIFQILFTGIISFFESIYKNSIYSKYEEENKNAEQRIESEKMRKIIADENKKRKERNDYEREYAKGILMKVGDLKRQYPYADSFLFDKYINNFNSMTFTELERLENQIKISNNNNLQTGNIENKRYNLNDIKNINPIEKHFEYPMDLKIFNLDIDYIILIKDLSTGNMMMYQSKNYLSILQLSSKILNELMRIKNEKLSIDLLNIDNFVNNIDDVYKINNII